MTDAMLLQAQLAAPDLHFTGWTSHKGPPSIQGEADGILATGPLLELVDKATGQGAAGIIVGCFDDTALAEAAKAAMCPVIGLGQAAYHYAALRQWRFSVVTTLAVSVPVLESNIRKMGLQHHLGRVRASDVPVLSLEADPEKSGRLIRAEAERAQAEDNIDAVVLGCAGMVKVVEEVRSTLNVAVIDPVACAARCFRWL